MTFWTFLAPLALIGIVHGGSENAWDCCVRGNSLTNTWGIHAPVLLLLVLTQKSNMAQNFSASVEYTDEIMSLFQFYNALVFTFTQPATWHDNR